MDTNKVGIIENMQMVSGHKGCGMALFNTMMMLNLKQHYGKKIIDISNATIDYQYIDESCINGYKTGI